MIIIMLMLKNSHKTTTHPNVNNFSYSTNNKQKWRLHTHWILSPNYPLKAFVESFMLEYTQRTHTNKYIHEIMIQINKQTNKR